MSGIGFNIAHDACHGAFSSSPKTNRFLSFALDVIGGSSYVWKKKHNIYHHTYTNLTGADDDIDLGLLARLSPHQERIGIHRFQCLYIWLLYAWLGVAWQYIDLSRVLQGRIGSNPMERPKGWNLVALIGGKILFFGLMLGLPIYQVGFTRALAAFFIASFTLGWTTAIVFQLAHCVEEAEFPPLPTGSKVMENEWAIHQLETTVNFAPRNPLLTWYLGGLNYQVEHHLFPKICHLHYPALAPIIQRVCKQFQVRYRVYPTMLQAIRSHYRFLKQTYLFPAPQTAPSDDAH
jgi:linoleoyl-CoA desaturase